MLLANHVCGCGLIVGCHIFYGVNTMAQEPRTEAERKASPKPTPMPGYASPVSRGQKRSLERGVATRSKKNPGKRARQG